MQCPNNDQEINRRPQSLLCSRGKFLSHEKTESWGEATESLNQLKHSKTSKDALVFFQDLLIFSLNIKSVSGKTIDIGIWRLGLVRVLLQVNYTLVSLSAK